MRTVYALFVTLCLLFTLNPALAGTSIAIGVGTPYSSNVNWVPGHWYHGYWIPGQYVEYAGPAPGPGFVWVQGGFVGGGYGYSHRGGGYRHGHWSHHGH